jgi:plasmid stability protein
MPNLQVPELPEDIYSRIKMKAQREQRTVAQEIVVLLRQALQKPEISHSRRLEALQRISQRKVKKLKGFPSSEDIIREDRNR